jgi:adenylate kinase
MEKRIFVFIGPPGSGKGTQAELLKKKFNLKHYSVGSILRREIVKKTVLGKAVDTYVQSGRLVPDKIIAELMFKKMDQDSTEIILDGFPRNLTQTRLLDGYLAIKKRDIYIIEITLPPKKVLQRVSGRLFCECGEIFHQEFKPPLKKGICDVCKKKLQSRSDANPKVAQARLLIYEKETKPAIKYYRQNKDRYCYTKINGNQKIAAVYKDILSAIK